jgi:hypothetical protein
MTLRALLTTVRDSPNCAITYNRHSDDSRGVIYNGYIFIIQATDYLPLFLYNITALEKNDQCL